MPADREYTRFLNLAVEEQLKSDEAASSGLEAASIHYSKRADAYRDKAKIIFNRLHSKAGRPLPV